MEVWKAPLKPNNPIFREMCKFSYYHEWYRVQEEGDEYIRYVCWIEPVCDYPFEPFLKILKYDFGIKKLTIEGVAKAIKNFVPEKFNNWDLLKIYKESPSVNIDLFMPFFLKSFTFESFRNYEGADFSLSVKDPKYLELLASYFITNLSFTLVDYYLLSDFEPKDEFLKELRGDYKLIYNVIATKENFLRLFSIENNGRITFPLFEREDLRVIYDKYITILKEGDLDKADRYMKFSMYLPYLFGLKDDFFISKVKSTYKERHKELLKFFWKYIRRNNVKRSEPYGLLPYCKYLPDIEINVLNKDLISFLRLFGPTFEYQVNYIWSDTYGLL